MTSTIDNICANIDARFDSLLQILNIYDGYDLDKEDADSVNCSINQLASIRNTYLTETLDVLTEFYSTDSDSIRKTAHTEFVKIFHASNIIGELNRIYNICQRLKKIYKLDEPTLPELTRTYERSVVDESFISTKSNICNKCQIPYTIEEKTAEYVCTECGRLEKMSGVVFEDEQFFYQEGQRTKHGKYDPVKHAKAWLDRIQAKEMTEIPISIINSIKNCIKRDCLWIDSITCDNIRAYLKQLKKTNYNNHVPLIRRLATNIEPDQLTEHETQLVYMYIGIVIQIYTVIKNDPNCPYLPFFIYKIIEQILKKPKNAERRKNILSCIHLQSRVTLVENDRLWFSICDYIPEFTKLPTNGHKR
jgi:hypothetical protein